MKLTNFALGFSLLIAASTPSLVHCTTKDKSIFLADNTDSTDGDDDHRYIVKFKSATAMKRTGANGLRSKPNVISVIEKENAEVMMLYSKDEVEKWENNDDVAYVEKGMYMQFYSFL